jgi:hypothetical protein
MDGYKCESSGGGATMLWDICLVVCRIGIVILLGPELLSTPPLDIFLLGLSYSQCCSS